MTDITIRDLSGMAEFRLAEVLQADVWGKADTADPADLMMVIQAEGGICAGAFLQDHLVGYVFGFPTVDPQIQHSHRLAVLPSMRGRGLGVRLKWYQREWCLARGIKVVRWTFDPIRATNASLNIDNLGAIARTYYPDYYGEMAGINAGSPSDRLLAEWFLDDPAVVARLQGRAPSIKADLRIAIPQDATRLLDSDPGSALKERLRLRDALVSAFAAGAEVTGFERERQEYILSQPVRQDREETGPR